MEVNCSPRLSSQDSLAAEVLTTLHSGSGFSTTVAPESFSRQQQQQPPYICGGSSFLPASLSPPTLTPSLLPQTVSIGQNAADSAGNVVLRSAGALDPAQAGSASLGGVGAPPPGGVGAPPPGGVCGPPPGGVCGPPPAPANNSGSVTGVSTLPSSANPAPPASHDAMTLTVQCSISDTIIVVGQRSWQCCMCQETCGFDSSIDQHLARKHSLSLRQAASEEGRAATEGGPARSGKHRQENEARSPPAEAADGRSGLEREVALLMAQTFTHSGGVRGAEEDVKHCDDSLVMSFSQEKQAHSFSVAGASNSRSTTSEESSGTSAEVGSDKDLKMQEESDCHEKKKYKLKYKCLVCHKLFEYIQTLYQHMVQENHQGGLPGKPDPSPSPDHETNDFSVTDDISFETDLKMEVDDEPEESEMFSVDLPSIAPSMSAESEGNRAQEPGEPAYEKILAALLSEGKQISSPSGRTPSLLQCFVCDQEIRNHNYYITRHARCHTEDLCYTCTVCEKEFYQHGHYRDHMLQHSIVSPVKDNQNSRVTRSKTKALESDQKQSKGRPKKGWNHPKPTAASSKVSNKGPKPIKRAAKLCKKKLKNPKPAAASVKARDKQIPKNLYSMKRKAQEHSIGERKSTQSSSPHSSSSSRPEVRPAGSSSRPHCVVRCHVCGLTFLTHAQKRLHMLKHRCTFQCRYCDAKFDSGAELLSHSQSCQKTGSSRPCAPSIGDMDIKPEGESRSEDGNQSASHGGLRGPAWKKEATGQVSSTPARKWTCSICDAVIVHSLSSISRHMQELHSDRDRRQTSLSPRPQPHRCRKCYRPFVSFAKLQHHIKTRHRDFEGICDVCGKTFRTKAAFRKHTMLHTTPEGKFQCPKCRFSFRYESRLEKHMRKHADRTGMCPHCGKVYISKIHLQRHISVEHLGIKDYRYKCDQCDAQFFEKLQLRDHIAYHHKGIQIYVCKYCHRGFNARPTLVRHERLEHTNYLPHKCKHCPQAFAEKSKLVAHEMTHTGMSPHQCEACGKYFTTGSALRIHKNLHLGIRPYECGACHKSYLKKWNLQQHVRKVHKTFNDVSMAAAYGMGSLPPAPPPPPLNQQ